MFTKIIRLTLLAMLALAININAQTTENRFEKQVQVYEAADKAAPPPKNAILLVGDSQFFRWKTLSEDLWVADRIHLNHDGYLVRVKIMRPLLGKPDKKIRK